MADHFEEVINVRMSAIEQRLDSEVATMQQAVNAGFAAMLLLFGRVMDRIEGLETRMNSLEAKLDGVLAIVQDLARRLPPTP